MLKIAIVDDDNACLEQEAAYTARYAKEKQLQIETSIFHSGMELMKQLSNRFDIIFLDIEMDGMDGMETAREIRKAGSDAVIVFITKQQNQYFYIHHLFNGEGRYNQSYPVNGKFDDYELFQVVIGWKQVLCYKNWFDNQRNALIGSAVYPYSEYTDFYRFEITFSNTNATSFYTNVLAVRRLYPDGKQEYIDQTVMLNTISGLRVVPR